MKLKNKYSKQNIYSNQKFEDQIWYNQRIMTFKIFHNFQKVFSTQNFQENTFLKTKPNFLFTEKFFSLTNFSNGKQTQESLKNAFSETTFQKTNIAKRKNTFLKTKPNFFWLKSVFRWPTFLMTNKHRKAWKMVFRKLLSGKQTRPYSPWLSWEEIE